MAVILGSVDSVAVLCHLRDIRCLCCVASAAAGRVTEIRLDRRTDEQHLLQVLLARDMVHNGLGLGLWMATSRRWQEFRHRFCTKRQVESTDWA